MNKNIIIIIIIIIIVEYETFMQLSRNMQSISIWVWQLIDCKIMQKIKINHRIYTLWYVDIYNQNNSIVCSTRDYASSAHVEWKSPAAVGDHIPSMRCPTLSQTHVSCRRSSTSSGGTTDVCRRRRGATHAVAVRWGMRRSERVFVLSRHVLSWNRL